MYSFETLLHASSEELVAIFSAPTRAMVDDKDAQRAQTAQRVGVNVTQLVCGVGFNSEALQLGGVVSALGYASSRTLAGERNYLFIHDRYQGLSVNNILEIYSVMASVQADASVWSDLVMSRLNNIEGQLEETINPILIGGYKLEVRAIYEHRLASVKFVNARLQAGFEVLRNIANESRCMLETKAIAAEQFISNSNITIDEKCRAVFQGLIVRDVVENYLSRDDCPENDRARLLEVLDGGAGE